MSSALKRVCLIGSGNWGTAIAKIMGRNILASSMFEKDVRMYVYEEEVNGEKLTDIINTRHENVKYLPGIKLPENIKAVPSLEQACEDANVVVFCIPHQFVNGICAGMDGRLVKDAVGISLIKGLSDKGNGLDSMSSVIQKQLGIPCSSLMGANLAQEVAEEQFSEATVGCSEKSLWPMYKELFHCDFFKINCVEDVQTVELCGALKNIVGVAAGFVDALELGDNSKAAVIRIGLQEIRSFAKMLNPDVNEAIFLESCGVADLITTCYGGRNRKVAEALARTGKDLEVLEKELLNGQKLQGPHTAEIVHRILADKQRIPDFPLFNAVYEVCYQKKPASHLINTLKATY